MESKFKNSLSVLILCGGEGQRLRPLTEKVPKPLIKIKEAKLKTSSVNKFVTGNIFVFSGFRDATLKSKIESYDGNVKDTINNKTTYLIVKEKEGNSSKIKKAQELGIKILTKDELENKI